MRASQDRGQAPLGWPHPLLQHPACLGCLVCAQCFPSPRLYPLIPGYPAHRQPQLTLLIATCQLPHKCLLWPVFSLESIYQEVTPVYIFNSASPLDCRLYEGRDLPVSFNTKSAPHPMPALAPAVLGRLPPIHCPSTPTALPVLFSRGCWKIFQGTLLASEHLLSLLGPGTYRPCVHTLLLSWNKHFPRAAGRAGLRG